MVSSISFNQNKNRKKLKQKLNLDVIEKSKKSVVGGAYAQIFKKF